MSRMVKLLCATETGTAQMVGVGDRYYSATFCGGPTTFNRLMQEPGAQRIGEMCLHDRQTSTFPDEFVLEWMDEWLTLLD